MRSESPMPISSPRSLFGRLAAALALALCLSPGSCGSTEGTLPAGGSHDGGRTDSSMSMATVVVAMGDGGLTQGVFTGTDGGSCLAFGAACASAGDCCSGTCTGSVCSYPACTSDTGPCTTNGDCCSQSCVAGACAALNTTCSTLGNGCTSNDTCCSKLCSGGTCQASSFCGQPGDACTTAANCCTGSCTVAAGQTLGTCAGSPPGGPANCGLTDGQLCSGGGADGGVNYVEGGLPQCGGGCCSRACAPWGPTGVLVCQPATGCHVVGDLCRTDTDCCGSAGLPGGSGKPVTCVITAPSTVGVCRLPMGCKPDGDVCKLKTMSCNSSCDCCAGNCENQDTCHQDNVGVPRCAGACVGAGQACASSANCCGGLPCVPNAGAGDGGAPYVCYGTQCVAGCGPCSTSADCCPGTSCILPAGSAKGVCGPCGGPPPPGDAGGPQDGGVGIPDAGGPGGPGDGGITCSQYGQVCTTSTDCCNGVPCTLGRCYFIPR